MGGFFVLFGENEGPLRGKCLQTAGGMVYCLTGKKGGGP